MMKSFKLVSMCVKVVARWFLENELLRNPAKSEAVLFGTKMQLEKLTTTTNSIDVAETVVPLCDTVRLL